ncbi:MAG: NADH-quinone oxidoreductase subunit M [archaeon]|nr:NADH-quinone oxidoreductase subunit M [archaeon]
MSVILSLLLAIPFVGAIITLLMSGPREKLAKFVALVTTAITLIIALYTLTLGPSKYIDLDENFTWIKTANIQMNYALHIDGLSALMMFMTSLLVFITVIFSSTETDRPNYFHALLLAIEVGLMGVYLAADYFLFYIMWEVTLIPMFFMISWYGGPRKHYSAIKFFIYTHVASLVMLIGIFAMVFTAAHNGLANFSFIAVKNGFGGSALLQTAIFGLLFFGFIVKMPIVPFHTWLPDAHVEAPTAGSVLLAGVMLKMGSYGIIRICIEVFESSVLYNWQTVMIGLGVLSMIYGAYACIAQTDLKKMVAYSSVSHMGMVLLAIGCLSEIGIEFAVFQMFAHGLITAVLFMVCGLAGHNIGTREIPLLGGLAGKLPIWSFFMMFGFMASLGLPGLVGFVAEFGILYAFWEILAKMGGIYIVLIGLGMLSMMLTAGYYLWAMQRTLFGDTTDKIDLRSIHDVNKTEFIALSIVSCLIVLFGIWPSLATNVITSFSGGLL